MTTNGNNINVVDYRDLDISKIIYKNKISKPDDKSSTLTTYINYDKEYQSLYIQTPIIDISHHGYTHPDYITDASIKNLNLPISENNNDFKDKLLKWQELLLSDKQKVEILGKSSKKYNMNKIIKFKDDDEITPPKFQVKIEVKGNDKHSKTRIYNGFNEENEIEYDTIEDFKKIVPFRTTCLFILRVSKIWAHKPSLPEPKYGIIFIIDKIFIKYNNNTNSQKNTSLNTKYLSDALIKDFNETTKEPETSDTKLDSNNPSNNNSDDSDDSDDSDSEPTKNNKAPIRKIVDSDVESDNEELKPKAKPKGKSKK